MPALLFCTGVVTASLIMPTAVVTYWLVRGVQAGESLLPVWAAASGAGVRRRCWQARSPWCWRCRWPTSPCAFPAATVSWSARSSTWATVCPALSSRSASSSLQPNYAPVVYQTLAMLIFSYRAFSAPSHGQRPHRPHADQPAAEEAERNLGDGSADHAAPITLPLLRPSIWTGAALVFMSTLKELPITLLLGPTGFTTLATQIWAAADEAFFARAAAPSLLLLAVSAVGVGIILRQEERRAVDDHDGNRLAAGESGRNASAT
ncbi:MAG: hypothetical protein R2838_11565 [Caldilineaceae bacterium]